MTILQAMVLGAVQGVTEFLPISSTAHLALLPYWLGWNLDRDVVFLFGVLVQLGTLAAVAVYFFRDLKKIFAGLWKSLRSGNPFADPDAKLGWMIVLGTVPAGACGLVLKSKVEAAFGNPRMIAVFLLGTALILTLADRMTAKKDRPLGDLRALDAILIGFGQALAIFPGVSRSGATIAAGLSRRFQRADAGRFSFLLSIPIMIAAGILSILDISDASLLIENAPELIIAAVLAAVAGFFAIRWLLRYISEKPFTVFSIYCAAVGSATLAMTFFR